MPWALITTGIVPIVAAFCKESFFICTGAQYTLQCAGKGHRARYHHDRSHVVNIAGTFTVQWAHLEAMSRLQYPLNQFTSWE